MKPGTTEQDRKAAKYACLKDAHRTWHWALGIPVVDAAFFAADTGNFYDTCMRSKGWAKYDSDDAKLVMQETNETLQSAQDVRNACVKDVRDRPQYSRIYRMFPDLYTARFSFAQTVSNEFPSAADASALATYFPAVEECHTRYLNRVGPLLTVEDRKIFQERDIEKARNASELTRGKMTYGDYATRENQSIDTTKVRLMHD